MSLDDKLFQPLKIKNLNILDFESSIKHIYNTKMCKINTFLNFICNLYDLDYCQKYNQSVTR